MKNERLYLAYGSNMDTEQMAYRCPDARLLGASEIEDWRLLFKGSKTGSYATIEPYEGSVVPVLVWAISARDERSLDRYEGYPRFYQKHDIEIELDGKRVTGMAYVMDESRPYGIPTQWYYDVLFDAYVDFGFDLKILEQALRDSLDGMKLQTAPKRSAAFL